MGVVGCVGVATWVGGMSGRGCVGKWEDGWAGLYECVYVCSYIRMWVGAMHARKWVRVKG